MYKHILICLDGSLMAEQILPYAERLASGFNSQVTLLKIVDLLVGIDKKDSEGKTVFDLFKQADEEAKCYLEKIAKSMISRGIQTNCKILNTRPIGKTIVDYAHTNSVDLIALVTHGYSGMDRFIIGSNAEYILKKAKVPVLVIKPRES